MDGGTGTIWHVRRPQAGKLHVNADALSRIPDTLDYCVNYKAGVPLSSLPCFSAENPCKFCTRAEEKWSHFERDVDYVVPLSVKQLQVGPELSQGFPNFWVPGYSVGDLPREQLDDPDLGVILQWLESEASPTQCELALKSPEVRHYWLMRDQLVFQDGVLSINGKMFWSLVYYWLYHLVSEMKFFTWIMIPEILGIWVSLTRICMLRNLLIGFDCVIVSIIMSALVLSVKQIKSLIEDVELV